MDRKVLCILLASLALLSGCPGENEITFEQGFNQIVAIFEAEGASLPYLTEDVFQGGKGLDAFMVAGLPEGTMEKAERLKAGLQEFRDGLGSYKQTEDVRALRLYCDLLVEMFNAYLPLTAMVESGEFLQIKEDLESMTNYEKFCGELGGETPGGIQSLFKVMGVFSAHLEKCGEFVSQFGEQAGIARVEEGYCSKLGNLMSMTDAVGEMLPLFSELCNAVQMFQELQESSLLTDQEQMCADPEAAKAEIARMSAGIADFSATLEKMAVVLEKYPDTQTDNFSAAKIRQSLNEIQLSVELLEAMGPQIELVCAVQEAAE